MSKFIEPEDVVPAAFGVVLGVCILVFFVLLVNSMGLQTIVDHGAIPRQ